MLFADNHRGAAEANLGAAGVAAANLPFAVGVDAGLLAALGANRAVVKREHGRLSLPERGAGVGPADEFAAVFDGGANGDHQRHAVGAFQDGDVERCALADAYVLDAAVGVRGDVFDGHFVRLLFFDYR